MNDTLSELQKVREGLEIGAVMYRNGETALDKIRESISIVDKWIAQATPTYTTGHCENKKHPKGCQLHNLHCGWPKCDRKPK